MLDMTLNEEDKPYFIVNIEVKDDKLIVTRADGTVHEEKFSEHNLSFYRTKMLEGAQSHITGYMDDLGKDSFFTFLKRYAAIVAGIAGLYFLYNIDIHIIMKILLTFLAIACEIGYYFYNELYLSIVGEEVIECLATEYYLKNMETFRYYDREQYIDGYIIPPEDIGSHGLTKEMLEQLGDGIKDYREQGVNPKDMKLTYKRREEIDENMV